MLGVTLSGYSVASLSWKSFDTLKIGTIYTPTHQGDEKGERGIKGREEETGGKQGETH